MKTPTKQILAREIAYIIISYILWSLTNTILNDLGIKLIWTDNYLNTTTIYIVCTIATGTISFFTFIIFRPKIFMADLTISLINVISFTIIAVGKNINRIQLQTNIYIILLGLIAYTFILGIVHFGLRSLKINIDHIMRD